MSKNSLDSKNCIIFFGPPGSGKGTQAEILSSKIGYSHVSTGVALRSEITAKSELGLKVKDYMDRGVLVPEELVQQVLVSNLESADNYILDGYPRNEYQANWLEKLFMTSNVNLQAVIELVVPDELLIKRILERAKESASSRSDDNEEVIKNRLEVFQNETSPLREFYKTKNVYHQVNGVGTIDQIAIAIENSI